MSCYKLHPEEGSASVDKIKVNHARLVQGAAADGDNCGGGLLVTAVSAPACAPTAPLRVEQGVGWGGVELAFALALTASGFPSTAVSVVKGCSPSAPVTAPTIVQPPPSVVMSQYTVVAPTSPKFNPTQSNRQCEYNKWQWHRGKGGGFFSGVWGSASNAQVNYVVLGFRSPLSAITW